MDRPECCDSMKREDGTAVCASSTEASSKPKPTRCGLMEEIDTVIRLNCQHVDVLWPVPSLLLLLVLLYFNLYTFFNFMIIYIMYFLYYVLLD